MSWKVVLGLAGTTCYCGGAFGQPKNHVVTDFQLPVGDLPVQYIALIYFPEEGREAIQPRMWQEYGEFTQEMIAKGYFKAGDALAPTSTATTVQVRDGTTKAKDGPYAETKEQLGGFYLFECKDLDEAISLAARIPDAKNGVIELRPIADHPVG